MSESRLAQHGAMSRLAINNLCGLQGPRHAPGQFASRLRPREKKKSSSRSR